MCGIIGFHTHARHSADEILATLHHRGPDSAALRHFQLGEKELGIGHTRLSILDLSQNGKQPMMNATSDVVLTFNGEIYNFKELKSKYFQGISFESETDTEVILKLYLKFGINFLEKLNGDFAFAVFDGRINKLFLVRDRAGVKPLYYYHSGEDFFFASEIKTLFKLGVERKINPNEIQKYLVFKYSPNENTLVEKVRRLKQGSVLEYDLNSGKIEIAPFWTLKKNPEYGKLNYRDAQEVLKELIHQAVEARLLADVPIASLLSGGLDSSIIAYYLKNHPEIQHYCAVKNSDDLKKEGSTSDGHYARLLAKEWQLNLTDIPIGSDEANLELIEKTLYYGDDLIADGSQIPSYLISREAAKKSRVILSGMGADELFLGYAGHQISQLSARMDKFPAFLKTPMYKWMGKLDQGKGRFLAYRRYLHKFGKYAPEKHLKYGFFNIVGDYRTSASLYRGNEEDTLNVFEQYFVPDEDVFDSIFKFEYDNFLQKNLNYFDRMSMANSVEGRVPFLDHNIIEFAYSIPRNYKLSGFGKSKKILKDSYASVLPPAIVNRRKAGFGMPLRSIFSEKEKIFALLDMDFFASFNGFSPDAIRSMIQLHLDGKEDHSAGIYALISFQTWYRIHLHKHS